MYIRVSSEKQDTDRQKRELTEYCTRNKLEIKYVFEEKISGFRDDRSEFKKLAALTKSDIDYIIVWELSRLGRNMSQVIQFVEDKAKEQICVICLKENFISLNEDGSMSPSTILMLGIVSAFAEIERTNIRERTISGRREKMIQGTSLYSGILPIGYKYDEDKKLVIDEKGAEVVRKVFELYKSGNSISEVSKIMNLKQPHVQHILSNVCYSGRVYRKMLDKWVETPQIISTEDFEMVRQIMKRNTKYKRTSLNTNILRGKIRCGICGGMMSKRIDTWRCHCNGNSIKMKFTNAANILVMNKLKEDYGFDGMKKELEDKVKELYKKASDLSEIAYSYEDKVEEETKKLAVLKDVFKPEQLRKEVEEIKLLQKERDKTQTLIDQNLIDIQNAEKNYENLKIDESLIDSVELIRISNAKKILVYHIGDKEIRVEVQSFLNKINIL